VLLCRGRAAVKADPFVRLGRPIPKSRRKEPMAVIVRCNAEDVDDRGNLVVRNPGGRRPPIRPIPPIRSGTPPVTGERIFVWKIEEQGGLGLAARGKILSFEPESRDEGGGFKIGFEVETEAPSRFLGKDDLKKFLGNTDTAGSLAKRILEYAPSCITRLTDDQTAWLDQRYPPAQLTPTLEEQQRAEPDDAERVTEEAAQEIARQKILGEQATRPGQQEFSKTMRNNYRSKCAITGCNTSAALQAAHIRVSKDADDNRPENGLLLRSDIHALFDALLITLSEDGATVKISEALTDPSYEFLRNAVVSQPEIGPRPSPENIRDHRNRFSAKEN
jgi:hypothetical protein